jgi:hypothetical protein
MAAILPSVRTSLRLLMCAVTCLGCTNPSTSPNPAGAPIDRLQMFVTHDGQEHVEIDFRRQAGKSILLMFRPGANVTMPRLMIDSIGPATEDPPELVEILKTFDVWAMADSNAAGGSCNTKSGRWVCDISHHRYTLVLGVRRGGVSRAQRYTRLDQSVGNKQARALADSISAWTRRKRQAGSQPLSSPATP